MDPQATLTLFVFGGRVVTLWKGTLNTFVRERVSIVAVTDMPGRNSSFSVTRIFTSKRVASCCWPPPIPPPREFGSPRPFEELAISVTVPLNLRSRNASTSSRAFWPAAMRTMSTSPMSTRASISLRSATVMTSVPVISAVPTTRSPSCELSLLTVPSSGELMVVLASSSSARASAARATSTWCVAERTEAWLTSKAVLNSRNVASEMSLSRSKS